MLINDHVVTDYLCNLRCGYCPCEVTKMKRRGNTLVFTENLGHRPVSDTVANFVSQNLLIIDMASTAKPSPILKLSGGELLLIPEFLDALPRLAERFAVVQILTNGTRLDEDIVSRLRKVGNLHLQVSLDGHNLAMNKYRFNRSRVLEKIHKGLVLADDAGIPLEVNAVLSGANTVGFFDFARWISKELTQCTLYPFPVRGYPELFPSASDVGVFRARLASDYDQLKAWLPPPGYLEELASFLVNGRRRAGCQVPHAVLGSHGDGTLEACTCGPVKTLGNVLGQSGASVYDLVGLDPSYALTRDPTKSPKCCHDCFTHYDVVNLYIEGKVSLAEMARMPLFAAADVITELLSLRAEFVPVSHGLTVFPGGFPGESTIRRNGISDL